MDLESRSLEALDWSFVLESLASYTQTPAGRVAARAAHPAANIEGALRLLDEVEELERIERAGEAAPGLAGIDDVAASIRAAHRGEVLEKADLRIVAATVAGLSELERWLEGARDKAPVLARRLEGWGIEKSFHRRICGSFTADGDLSEEAYPQLGELRRRISTLERQARAMLEAIVAGGQFDSILQDRYLTVRSDRYVLPIKAQAKSVDFGIVHDASRSGQTLYVEPHRVVPLNNERRLTESHLRVEEHRILRTLSADVARHAEVLAVALEAATAVDFAAARWRLGRRMGATRPVVGEAGSIVLLAARHPVLVLEGVDVVANDLAVDAASPVLVLSGPNAGGKTVALKTIALAALFVRIGLFVTAAEGSRVDFFPELLADIGDRQTVHEGLSSFSGHLATLRGMLDSAREGALLLLDELAAGTDPSQGGALARALIERFADAGARVVVTTHYAQLKGAAAADSRFRIAAMEYRDERPTYRVVPGMAGESHGFDAALRAGIDAALVERAKSLMDQGERALHEALSALEAARAEAERRAEAAEAQAAELRRHEAAVSERERKATQRIREIEAGAASAFMEKLRAAEAEVARVIAGLQAAPTSRGAGHARDELRELHAVAGDVERIDVPPSPLALEVGASVKVKGLGLAGDVVAIREHEIEIRARGMTLRVGPEELEVLRVAPDPRGGRAVARPQPRRVKHEPKSPEAAVRMDGNTLDLRGARVAEGLEELERFLDEAVLRGDDCVFVLHGHGTGALKAAIRKALSDSRYVEASAPAAPEQGGDAFTVAVLRE